EMVAEEREMDVGWPPGVAVVLPWVGAWFDGDEAIAPLVIRQAAPPAAEVGTEQGRMLVVLVHIAPGRVRLPDLDDGVSNRPAVAIQYATGDDDALPDRFAAVLAGEVMIELGDRSRKERSRKIMEPGGQAHQWLRRRAQAGANVVGVQIRRLDRVFPVAHLAFPPPPLSSETSETLPPPLAGEGRGGGICNQYPTGNTCRCSRLLTKPQRPRGR